MGLLDSSTVTDSREVDSEIEDLQENLLAEWQEQRKIERAETGADREGEDDEDEPDMYDIGMLTALKIPGQKEDLGNLIKLLKFREEARQYCEWDDGETLIEADYFKDYAEEVANDIGAVDRNASWPLNHIDWEAAADALKEDYVSVSFGDAEWYVRNS